MRLRSFFFLSLFLVCIVLSLVFWSRGSRDAYPKTATNASESGSPVNKQPIVLSNPLDNSLAVSPLTISGKAKGIWSFDGSLIVQVVDDRDNQIAVGKIQSDRNWENGEYGNFFTVLKFPQPKATLGTLLFLRQNSSEDSGKIVYQVPVRFK